MSQAIATSATSSKHDQPYDQESSERRFLNLRAFLDAWLILGGLFMASGMFFCVCRFIQRGSGFYSLLWLLANLVSCSLIVGITCRWVSSVSRRLVFLLLLVFLLTIYVPNYLVWWFASERLIEVFDFQCILLGFSAWGMIGLGLICVEQRAGDRVPDSSFHDTVFSPKKVISRLVSSFMLGCGASVVLALIVLGKSLWFDQCASSWWPVAEAVLVEPAEPNGKWLNYTYQVNGVDYFGSREVTFFNPESNFSVHGDVEERLLELKTQSVFPVSYNPSSASKSLLEPGVSNLLLTSIWASCAFVFLIPIGMLTLRDTYRVRSVFKRKNIEFSVLEIVAVFMALAGFALHLISAVLLAFGFDDYVFAILLIIAIGWVYRQCKKAIHESQVEKALTTVAT